MNVEKMGELILTEGVLIKKIVDSDEMIDRCTLGLQANRLLMEMCRELCNEPSGKDVDIPDFIKERMSQK